MITRAMCDIHFRACAVTYIRPSSNMDSLSRVSLSRLSDNERFTCNKSKSFFKNIPKICVMIHRMFVWPKQLAIIRRSVDVCGLHLLSMTHVESKREIA